MAIVCDAGLPSHHLERGTIDSCCVSLDSHSGS